VQISFDQTGCGKRNMAVLKPEIPITQLPGEIETKFKMKILHFYIFEVQQSNGIVQILSVSISPGADKLIQVF